MTKRKGKTTQQVNEDREIEKFNREMHDLPLMILTGDSFRFWMTAT